MKKILAGNWKLHKTRMDVTTFVQNCSTASDILKRTRQTRTIIIPSPVLLESAVQSAGGSRAAYEGSRP